MTGPTQRFSARVEDYARYRPGYPAQMMDLLAAECGLVPGWAVADVGSGTGLLGELFLKRGNRVFGVEPNAQMRGAAERLLARYAGFTSVAGSAEATTLGDGSVDLVAAGQALHWFDAAAARAEFARILRGERWAVFAWNARKGGAAPLSAAYEELLRAHGTDYLEVGRHEGGAGAVAEFFGDAPHEARTFDNRQLLDLDSFRGRLASSSYVPAAGEPGHDAMMRDAERLFEAHQRDGRITFEYDTKVYYGRLEPA